MDLELEKNKMIPGFVEGIVGMKIDDNKTLNLKFPEDYSHEDSRGKEAIFEVSLKDLKEKELPELNDDFAKQSCLLYTSPSPRDRTRSRMPSSA